MSGPETIELAPPPDGHLDRGSYERRHIRRPICDFLKDSLGQRSDQTT